MELDILPQTAPAVSLPALRLAVLTPVQRAAFELFDQGFNVAPTKPVDAPNPADRKRPFMWRPLTTTRISREFIPELFDNRAGILVIVGRLSMYLTVLDCDTEAAFTEQRAEFKRRGLSPWIVRSARGGHIWWLSADGEIANLKDDQADPRGWEIRGNCRYVVAPPTVHPSGVIYEWLERAGPLPPVLPIGALDWLPLKPALQDRRQREPREVDPLACLSSSTREFIGSGAPVGTRNNRLFAAACDMAGNDFPFQEARAHLTPAAERAGLDRAEIADTVRSAYSVGREPARKNSSRSVRRPPVWKSAAAWADRHEWQPLEGQVNGRRYSVSAYTARRVFLACVERARRDYAEVWRASTREVAEIAGTTSKTAYAALVCFESAGWLRRCHYNQAGAALFAFAKTIVALGNSIPPTGSVNSVTFCNKNKHDAFARGALNDSGERVWKAILLEPMKPAELARRLKLNRSTVGRTLDRLARHGLAERVGRVWHGNPASDDFLSEVAAACGTLGAGERRRQYYRQERALYASKRLLRAKRRWETRNRMDHETVCNLSETVSA